MKDKDATLADDLLVGAAALALYIYGDAAQRRKIYSLWESQTLPLFRLGREVCGRKSTIRKWMDEQEAGR